MKKSLIAVTLGLFASINGLFASTLSLSDFVGSGATFEENVVQTSLLAGIPNGSARVRIGYFNGGMNPGLQTLLNDPNPSVVHSTIQTNFVPLGEGLDPELGSQTATGGPRFAQRTVNAVSQPGRMVGNVTGVVPTTDPANSFNPANIAGVGAGTRLFVLIYNTTDPNAASELGIFGGENWLMPSNTLVNLTMNSVDVDLAGEVIRGDFNGPSAIILEQLIPEPSTGVMALLAGLGLVARRRR